MQNRFKSKDSGGILFELALTISVLMVGFLGVLDVKNFNDAQGIIDETLRTTIHILTNSATIEDYPNEMDDLIPEINQLVGQILTSYKKDPSDYTIQVAAYTESFVTKDLGYVQIRLKQNQSLGILNMVGLLRPCTAVSVPINVVLFGDPYDQNDNGYFSENDLLNNAKQDREAFC